MWSLSWEEGLHRSRVFDDRMVEGWRCDLYLGSSSTQALGKRVHVGPEGLAEGGVALNLGSELHLGPMALRNKFHMGPERLGVRVLEGMRCDFGPGKQGQLSS